PFPVVFAVQNAGAFWEFGAVFEWSIACKNLSLSGGATVTASETSSPGEPWIYVNASRPPNIHPSLSASGTPFPLWGGDQDACKLDWLMTYVSECTRYPNGSVVIDFGPTHALSGSVNFTLKTNGNIPSEQLGRYASCPIYGGSVQV